MFSNISNANFQLKFEKENLARLTVQNIVYIVLPHCRLCRGPRDPGAVRAGAEQPGPGHGPLRPRTTGARLRQVQGQDRRLQLGRSNHKRYQLYILCRCLLCIRLHKAPETHIMCVRPSPKPNA